MNKKEAKIARQSALAATACAECVRARGHQFDDSVSFPIVVEDELKDLKDDYKDGFSKILYNGETVANVNEAYLKASHKGLTVEIYEDPTNDDKMIAVVTEAYAAELTDIKTDDDDKVTEVTVDVYEASKGGSAVTLTIDADDDKDAYDIVKGYKEDDVFALYLKPGWDAPGVDMDKAVLAAEDVEAVEGKVTAKSADSSYNGWIKIDGTKYDFAWEYSQVAIAVKDEGTYYIHNGYVLHSDKDANKSDDEYLFVVRKGADSDTFGAKTYYAEVVFTDGTSKTVELDITETKFEALKQGAYSFTYDKDDDNYELTDAKAAVEKADIEKGKTALGKVGTANGKTVYVITQDPELICQCCTDILHLEAGHIAACYPMDAAGVGRIRDFFRVDGVTT